jgi:hypothetical protein
VRPALVFVLASLIWLGLMPASAPAAPSPQAAPAAARKAAERRASLAVRPQVYVAGQGVLFRGNIGRKGRRVVHLQTHMGRPGDVWSDVAGSRARTRRDGSFRFRHPAPGMFTIKVRVASGRLHTRPVTFNARSQDLVLDVSRSNGMDRIKVDTTPTLRGRQDLPPPAFPGRTLTLQRRVAGGGWDSVDTTTTDSRGNGSFAVPTTAPDPVYRVRQESWTRNGSQVGWFPSFPTAVGGGSIPVDSGRGATSTTTPAPTSARGAARLDRQVTASQTHGWAPSLWDFAWEYGESLTSRPFRGTDRRGWWLDTTTGTGRAAKHNGGLSLDSHRLRKGEASTGTTTATLRGNARTYGRWETKLRLKVREDIRDDFRVRAELVPDGSPNDRCGVITLADFASRGSSVTMGVTERSGAHRRWTRTVALGSLERTPAAFAAEVTKRHISWFINGKVVGTIRNQDAVPGVPLTMRLSLVDNGGDMNQTQVFSDWQRGFSLDRGRLTTNGPALQESGGC